MTKTLSRRQFLVGAGGAVMAIPFLPSLATRTWAADPAAPPNVGCFFTVGTGHGNIWGQNMYPPEAVLTQGVNYAGRTVRFGPLPNTPMNGVAMLSPCLMANSALLDATLISKINVLRGLDIPYRIGHHDGGYLGNFSGNLGNNTGGMNNEKQDAATIDQFLAYSPSFYSEADLQTNMTQRSFCVLAGDLSWNYASPATKSGDVVSQPAQTSNQGLFNFFFKPGTSYNGIDVTIIDRVKESYARLKKDPRLSKADGMRLDQHVERMFEIERKLQVAANLEGIPAPPAQSSDVFLKDESFNQDPGLNKSFCYLLNDIIVAAFAAGVSRIGTWRQKIRFTGPELITDWHGNVGHEGYGSNTAQQWALMYNQGTFEHIFVDLAAKMDQVPMPDGSTLLDNSLVAFLQEAGQITHQTGIANLPVITAGGAGGFFKTGNYVDFTNKDVQFDDLDELIAQNPKIDKESPGLYYQQFLGNVLQSMGVPAAEYETFSDFNSGEPTKGYGFHHVKPAWAPDYAQAKLAMGEKLPVIT